ncbi:MAG: methylmalonyl-CoA mutase family protein [Candidatus Thermoplasmatota archaeon]|jgi:methylmalonyl-CoA mutase N-terminal domain/subunit|nr:methylmalonyl-CoA mutase family protein [Candidatus Thermoplasmatota archaeon]
MSSNGKSNNIEHFIDIISKKEKKWRDGIFNKELNDSGSHLLRKNLSDIDIDVLYTPTSYNDQMYEEKLGFPSQFPYTRGIHHDMYRGRLWTIRQFSGFATAEESNERLKYLLSQGETGLSIAFDTPTLYGIDADNDEARGEIGKCGVSISTLEDMQTLFGGIPLGNVSTSMTINSPASTIWAMYIVTAETQGFKSEQLRGTIQNDILKEYIAQKEYIYPPEPSLKLVIDTFEYGIKHTPLWNPISISGYHIREAGSTAVQELAFTLYDGITYVEESIKRKIEVDAIAPRLSFFFNAHNDFFEEIAKYRAARRIWAKVMKDRFHTEKERSMWLRFHTQTAGCSATSSQPENNIIRTTIQALAAVLGGTQSLHTNSYDEALALPSEKAVKIALRTQQIIAYESGVTNTVDPLGGSYYIEWLTDKMEEEVMKYFDKLDAMGGMVKAIERGYVQKEIQEASYRYQREMDAKKRIVVGVNKFIEDSKIEIPVLVIDQDQQEKAIKKVKQFKERRNSINVEKAKDKIKKSAETGTNMMYPLIDAVKAGITVGEITHLLVDVYGKYRERSTY